MKSLRERLHPRSESRTKRFFQWVLLIGLMSVLVVLFAFTVTVAVLSVGLPDVRDFDKLAGVESTVIYDRKGGILYTVHGEENRKYVPLSDISPDLPKATLAIEDDQFYEHSGFDVSGIGKAVLHEVFGLGARRGGSTITQQLAKNAFLTSKREYTRKLKELILAVRLERAYDKNKILELYLNRIPYGNNAYGAEMAARMYFGKPARELTLGESAILASMPKAPTFYSPYGPNAYSRLEREITPDEIKNGLPKTTADLSETDWTIGLVGKTVQLSPTHSIFLPGRANVVLRRMNELGVITDEQRTKAENEIEKIEFTKHKEAIRAAHFVFEIRRQLEEQFGKDLLAQGGLQVHTTLDPDLQKAAEDAIEAQIKVSKETHGTPTAALLATNPRTGEVLAMVGSADYFDVESHGNVNHVYARRQPGSTFKPIVYAKAFLNRYGPATVLYDTPIEFDDGYKPKNYEGSFRGPMPIRQALAQSRNLPARKAYFLAGQQPEIVTFAQKLGLTSLDTNADYGPPLAIGAAETTLAEMVQAFSVFATNGMKRAPYDIVKVQDRNDEVLYEHKPEDNREEQVLDPQVAYLINNILSDKSVYLGPRLDVPGHTTAAKTGTSTKPDSDLPSNLWTMGYTPSVVTGVWAGNSDGSALKANADGYNVAAPIWASFMKAALKDTPDEKFAVPEGIKNVVVSRASGKLPSADTPESGRVSEIFTSFGIPTEIDDIYKNIEVNKIDGKLPNEFTPKEQVEKRLFMNHHDPILTYSTWQSGIRQWVTGKRKNDSNFPDFPPTETTKVFTAENAKNAPVIEITSPIATAVITQRKVPIEVHITAPNGISKVSFFLGDRNVPNLTTHKPPYSGSVRFSKTAKPGVYIITARVFDQVGYVSEAKVEVRYDGDLTGTTDTQEDPADEPTP